MCPACITTMALVAATAASTGGLAALIARTLHRKDASNPAAPPDPESREGSTLSKQIEPQGDVK